MPNPQPGEIFWSPAAQQFYQVGRVGALSRLEGIESLTALPFPGGWIYYDQRGNPTPSPADLLPNGLLLKSGLGERTSTGIGNEVYSQTAGDNEFYRTWFTYRDAEGGIHLGFVNGGIGRSIDNEVERSREIVAAANELGLELGQTEVSYENLVSSITSTFHSIMR